ncbi:MAG: hypothetical protein ABJ205_15800 [Erythrobacter sp.]|uniref:hypothetical protein n=1 Tax=Erythrobacter sp. TaxID=1042 RepID=UPI003266EBF0
MKVALISALGLAMAATAIPAEASGSGSGASRGGWGGASGSSGISEAERLNRRGRSQVRKHITCKKCDYHDRLDRSTAVEVAQGVQEGRFEIKQKDRTAVLYYLRGRFGV